MLGKRIGYRFAHFLGVRIEKAGDFDSVSLQKIEFPELKPGEVLVKMKYSTINPSDVNTAFGKYPVGQPPLTLGLEGCGTVVSSGKGIFGKNLIGKNVALTGKGTWAEYCVANSEFVYPLYESFPLEQAGSFIVNPMTVMMFVEKIKTDKHQAAVMNPAASALGKIMIKYCRKLGIPLVNLVRRPEQVKILKNMSEKYVFNTSEKNWVEEAKRTCDELKASVAFDAVAGPGTSEISQILVDGSCIYNYGTLSGEECRISGPALRFRNQRLEGLWVTSWLVRKTHEERMNISETLQKDYKEIFATEYSQVVDLNQVKKGLLSYVKGPATDNKILIKID